VLAAGYDAHRNLLAFIDEGAAFKGKIPLARVVIFDTAKRAGKVVLTLRASALLAGRSRRAHDGTDPVRSLAARILEAYRPS
jgi:hypothetical protein